MVPSRRLVALTLVPLTLLMAAIALPIALTRWAPHDDEGFYLYSLRLFAQHGGIYSHVVTAYGPAYHELMAAPLALLRVSIDHNSGRVMTGIMTALIAAAAALVCLRLTGRLSAAALGGVVALIAALPVTGEPMEPSILVLLFLSLMVLAVSGPGAGPVRRGLLVGACVAVLALTKINIGAYAGVAALVALLGVSARPRSPLWAVGLALGLAPPVILLVAGRDDLSVVGFALAGDAAGGGVAGRTGVAPLATAPHRAGRDGGVRRRLRRAHRSDRCGLGGGGARDDSGNVLCHPDPGEHGCLPVHLAATGRWRRRRWRCPYCWWLAGREHGSRCALRAW